MLVPIIVFLILMSVNSHSAVINIKRSNITSGYIVINTEDSNLLFESDYNVDNYSNDSTLLDSNDIIIVEIVNNVEQINVLKSGTTFFKIENFIEYLDHIIEVGSSKYFFTKLKNDLVNLKKTLELGECIENNYEIITAYYQFQTSLNLVRNNRYLVGITLNININTLDYGIFNNYYVSVSCEDALKIKSISSEYSVDTLEKDKVYLQYKGLLNGSKIEIYMDFENIDIFLSDLQDNNLLEEIGGALYYFKKFYATNYVW